MRLRNIFILLVGAVCSWLSAGAALDLVNEQRAQMPLAGAASHSGFALADRAMAGLADDAADAHALSIAALAKEPLAGGAVRNLAMLDDSNVDLLLLAQRISRRDMHTSFQLANAYAQRGETTPALAQLDQAMRTSRTARRTMLPALFDVLGAPTAVPLVAQMLASNVSWEDDFWAAAPAADAALPQLASLRAMRAEAGYQAVLSHDRALFRALVRGRQFAAAQQLASALHGTDKSRIGAVHNASFARAPVIGPFDWDLRQTSGVTAYLDQQNRQLRLQSFGGGEGLAARQLVTLPGDTYQLQLRASEWDPRDAASLSIHLTCAERSEKALLVQIDAAQFTQTIRKSSADCRYYWLDVMLAPQVDRRENTVLLDSIALYPAQDAQP